jgi:hypothetical protein
MTKPPNTDSKRKVAKNDPKEGLAPQPSDKITERQMEEILIRARQTVKPIVNREALCEVISEEILSFKMK